MLCHSVEEEIAGFGHTPAEHDARRVEGVLDVDAGDGEIEAGFVPDAQTECITVPGTLSHTLSIDRFAAGHRLCQRTGFTFFDGGDYAPRDGAGGCVLLEAAPLAA